VNLSAKLGIVIATLALFGCRGERAGSVVDDVGRSVQLPAPIRRVITLAPNLSEIVAFIGGQSLIVGTDDFSDYPASIKSRPRVGGVQPNLETLASLHPDLVISSSSANHPALAPSLATLSIPLFVARTDRLADIPRSMERLGALLNLPDHQRIAEEFRQSLEAERRARRSSPKVLFIVWTDPLYVAGRSTFMNDLIELTGSANAAGGITGWPQFSLETLVWSEPDVLLFPSRSIKPDQFEQLIRRDARWRNLKCVREGSYFAVDEDVFTRPGPRVLEAARALNRILDERERR